MADVRAEPDSAPCEPDIDENGVDRVQIREMLDLTLAERLSTIAEFMSSLLAIRALHPPIRLRSSAASRRAESLKRS